MYKKQHVQFYNTLLIAAKLVTLSEKRSAQHNKPGVPEEEGTVLHAELLSTGTVRYLP